MGDSLCDVRVHTGLQAAAAYESIDTRAFLVGDHVAFDVSEYDPESEDCMHVFAHELAHVRRRTNEVSPTSLPSLCVRGRWQSTTR